MAEQTKFTDEELKSIRDFQTRYQQVTTDAGVLSIRKIQLEFQLTELEVRLDAIKNVVNTLRDEESKFGDMLQKKYGDGELNPTTGVFTPRPSPPPQS